MSEHRFDWPAVASVLDLCAALATALRPPTSVRQEPGALVIVYTPDLSAAEQTTLAATVAETIGAAKVRDLSLTPDEWKALRPSLDTLRTFQQLTQAQWMALTANQRERQTFDVLTAQLRVLRAILRD